VEATVNLCAVLVPDYFGGDDYGGRNGLRVWPLWGRVLYCFKHSLRGTRSRSRGNGYVTAWHGLISVTADNLARFGARGKHASNRLSLRP
jgi:hypothetical protein